MSTQTQGLSPVEKHQRDVRLKIVAPIALAFLAVILLGVLLIVGVATDALVFEQVSVIMGILATAFITLPLVLLCLIPYLLFAVMAVGAGKIYERARPPIRFVRRFTERMAARTARVAPRLARPLIGFNARVARWEQTLLGWQRSALQSGKENPNE